MRKPNNPNYFSQNNRRLKDFSIKISIKYYNSPGKAAWCLKSVNMSSENTVQVELAVNVLSTLQFWLLINLK